ncbi:MAG: HAD family acid phosphatase [Polyangiaceae bacterium]
MLLRTSLLLVSLAGASLGTLGCSASGSADTAPEESALTADGGDGGVAPAGAKLPNEIQWFRNSAEYQVLSRMAYRDAARAVDEKIATRRDRKAWGVVLDIDETVLDNSTYQKERSAQGLGYSPDSWNEWVQRKAAPAIPGALAFTSHVRAAGGKVVFVAIEMRRVALHRENLRALGAAYDAILCTPTRPDRQEPALQGGGERHRGRGARARSASSRSWATTSRLPDTDQSIRLSPEEARRLRLALLRAPEPHVRILGEEPRQLTAHSRGGTSARFRQE